MSIETKMDEARSLLLSGKLEESKDIFQDIIKNQPSHYKAHTNIGAINAHFADAEPTSRFIMEATSKKAIIKIPPCKPIAWSTLAPFTAVIAPRLVQLK